jgi:hypothetical protein
MLGSVRTGNRWLSPVEPSNSLAAHRRKYSSQRALCVGYDPFTCNFFPPGGRARAITRLSHAEHEVARIGYTHLSSLLNDSMRINPRAGSAKQNVRFNDSELRMISSLFIASAVGSIFTLLLFSSYILILYVIYAIIFL